VVCRAQYRGENPGVPCPRFKVKGAVRVNKVTGHKSTLTLEESKTIKAREKAARQARELARATAFARRLAPAMVNPALAANPGAAAAASAVAARYSRDDHTQSSGSFLNSSLSSSQPPADPGGVLAFAHSYASIDEVMFSQQGGDAQFDVLCNPWEGETGDCSDSDGD